jgi:hypothetical protein
MRRSPTQGSMPRAALSIMRDIRPVENASSTGSPSSGSTTFESRKSSIR